MKDGEWVDIKPEETGSEGGEWVDIKPEETGSEDGEWVDIKPSAAQPLKPGSPTWAAIKGGIGGFFEGAWAGGNAAANKIAKALPEVGIGLESAIGHAARFAGKGLKTVGAEKVGAAVESAGEGIVASAAGAKAWLDAKLPSEAKDWLGYEDWSTKASDWVGNAAAMAVKFAPGGAKVGGEAFMEAVLASDGANAFANTYDTAIAHGASEAEATALGGEAALINYFGGKALMKSGGWAAGIEGAGKQFLASGAASSATMAAQGAGNKMVENLAERKPLMEGVAAETGKGLVEGAMFHVYNAIPGYARGVVQSREARREHEAYIKDIILERAKTDQGAARLALYLDGPALDEAIRARKAGKKITRRMISDIRLPEVMTPDEAIGVIDVVSAQRRAWAERARTQMDDVQAQALAETVAQHAGEDKALFESTWLKVLEKIEDARELDDPARREELVQAAIGERAAGEAERSSAVNTGNAERGKAMDLLGKMDEGALPVEDVAIGDVEGLAASDNGNVIEAYDAAKAKPIIVWEDYEGNRHAVTGGKRLAAAGASGAETVKAVVIKEADGWTQAEARSIGAVENLKEGSGGLKNVVEAVDAIGADGVAEIAGWHQAYGSREAASMIRRGLAVAQKGGEELKAALAEGRIDESFAYNAAQVLSMERVGEGWEAAQRELAGLIGKVGPEELEAVLWGLKGQLSAKADLSDIDWKAAIAEERAKYNAKKGGADGKLDSDQVLIETADGELKTLGEIESDQPVKGGSPGWEGETAGGESAEAPELAAAQGAGANRAVELRPVQGRDGVFGTLSHPKARFTVDGEGKVVYVEGLTPEDFAPEKAGQTASLVARIEAYAVGNGLKIGIGDEATLEAWRATRDRIKAEAEEAFSRRQAEERRSTVVERLKQSGLATEVVETKGDFDRMLVELNGRPLTADEEVYGFCDTSTGKVYLNPDFFATRQALEAPIHEFGHLGIIAAEKVNKPVYDRGMKLAGEILAEHSSAIKSGETGVAEIVDFILNDKYYSTRSRKEQAEELLAQLIGKRGAEALKNETNKTVVNRIKAWLVEFWNTFGKAMGLKDITPEQAEKMTVEEVADAIRAEMLSGRKYGEGLDRVEFGLAEGGSAVRIVTKPVRIKRKLTGRRKAVNEFVKRMGGGDDPANVETDLLALWVDNGGRLFDAMPYEISTGYSKGASGVKKTRRAVADEFAESTEFYRGLDAAQRRVFFGTGKLEPGSIGEGLKQRLAEAGITRFTNEDGTVDYEGLIDEFKRQWTNYERGDVALMVDARGRRRLHDVTQIKEETLSQLTGSTQGHSAAPGISAREVLQGQNPDAGSSTGGIIPQTGAGAQGGVKWSRSGIFTGTAADYANRSRQGGAAASGRAQDRGSVGPSALGDGKQRYYEVPFDKAVDKIVKNKKPVSDEHVFISETPGVFKDIGLPALPVMMNQSHVLSCYFGNGEGVKAGNMHGLGAKLKSLPKAIAKPMMVIANDSNPSSSVIAIVKMQDRDGHTVIAPVEINGIGRSNEGPITANVVKSAFGKKNLWSEKVAKALRDEIDGKVAVFYVDSNEARQIENRLAREAFNFGKSERQLLSVAKGTVHSIADFGSPVKGVGAQTDSRQFKRWFANSKVVVRSGNPRIVYHGTPNGKFWTFDKNRIGETWNADETGFFFTSSKSQAEEYTRPYFRENTATPNLFSVYLSIQNPLVIDQAWWQKQFGRSDIYNHDAIEIWDTEQRTILDAMREGGHDGVIIDPSPMGGAAKMYMVPEPTQIKSATDNIGTFDAGNADIRFARSGSGLRPPEAELVKMTRVADDAGVGERTPGAIAASRELSRQGAVPLTTKGTRYVSLPLSEMNALARYLTGHAMPGEMASGRKLGAAGKASMKERKLVIAADVLGTIDKSDMAAEKAVLKQHGYFAHEDAQWAANHSPQEMRAERERSEEALSSRLEGLADRRAQGKAPGGQAAARRVYADQLAKIVMAMPHDQPGVLGAMQTVADALEKRVRGNEGEAEAFLNWMSGQAQTSGQAPRSAQERKAEMFAAFLIMPKEMEARAKGWYDAIRSTIAGDKKLAEAFREMTVRMMTEEGYGHLQAEIEKDISRQHEQAVAKLNSEADESIKPKSRRAQIKEAVVLTCDDKGGAALVRIGERERMYLGGLRKLMKQAKTPQERALIKQQIDAYLGDMGQKLNTLALARAAWERGSGNADSVYDMKLCDALNEALVRDGLRFIDLSLYLDQQRVIESKGLSGSRGESARQAQIILDTMKKRLGADFAKVEAFAQKFHAIHEQEFLNSPALERVLGKRTLDAWRENIHYVTTKRQFSPEELKEIEAKRAELRKTGAFGGDDMVGDVYKYATRLDPTAGLRGSFASKREVMSATMEKTGAIMHWARKCNYVIELRDALLAAGVEGVHDIPAGTNELKSHKRYGTISYVENGQKRMLVVPREIAEDFKRTSSYDNAAIRLLAACNNFARRMVIDYNLPYGLSNMWRNVGSAESNVPGMREAAIKRASRFVVPGAATAEEIAMQLLVRNMPEKWSLPLRKMWGEHTALYWLPQAKRIAMWLTDYNKMQRKFWEAEQRGDLGTLQQMEADRRWAIMAKRANMFHSMTTGRIADPSMLDAQMQRGGMTLMSSERRERDAKPKWRRALDFVNIFQRNARQQVYEDVLIKTIVFLHDRAQFGKTHNRTLEESGLIARKYAGIPETERKGLATPGIQALFNPFWGAIEKGVVRHVDAIRERPKETLQKDAWRLSARITSMLLGNGALAAYILYLNDGDKEKAKNGKLGAVYSYARGYQRAYQNCSNYVRNNYHITPLWTKGYTSIILGMPLTDEERILEPVASLISDAASVAAGTKQSMHMQEHLLNMTKVIAPDFKMAGFGVTLFDDTLGTFLYEPEDYYTGGYKYDRDLYATRYESLSDFGQFSWAVAKRLWNDFGGRGILPTDRAGVDNGLGEEPGWVARAVNSIPIASPYARRMVKVQVGSPRRDAAEILEAERIRQAVIRKSARAMFKIAHDEKRDLWLTPERYNGMLEKWQQAYGLSPDELAKIEEKYLNAWRAYEGAQYRADGEREKFRAKAEELGLKAAGIWLDWD